MTGLIWRALADLRAPDYPVAGRVTVNPDAAYPLDMGVVADGFRTGTDGVVVVAGPDGEVYHNPVSVSLYALTHHARLRHSDAVASRIAFLAQAQHLRRSQDAVGGWRYPVPVARYGVLPGWYSAMAQGLAASVLLRAAAETGEASYQDAAAAAVRLLLAPLEVGGCSHYDSLGRPFPEECPASPPGHILNGAVFALIGLAEYESCSSGDRTQAVTLRLADSLPHYDLGYWSRYDLRFNAPATLAYHCLHISLLTLAGRFFPGHGFTATANRWAALRRRPSCRVRAAVGKAAFVLRHSSADV